MEGGESPKKLPRKAKKEAKKEEKEARKEEKLKEKQRQEELKQKQKLEEREAKKERNAKKKIQKKIPKKLATPYGDVSGTQSIKDLSSIVLADYEVEASFHKQLETFLNDTFSKISKSNQKIQSVLEERRQIIKDISENASFAKEKHPSLDEALQQLVELMTFQTNLLMSYFTSLQTPDEENTSKSDAPTNDSKSMKKEYFKLLNRYEQFDTKIHATTKEKAVTAVAMHKLTEAEQMRELIKSRLKQIGHVMLVQQQDTTSALILSSMNFVCATVKLAHQTHSDGFVHLSQQIQWINQMEDKLRQSKQEIEEKQRILEVRINELGTDKWFDQIIKKKDEKDEDLSLGKSPVIHITTSKGALELVKTLLHNNSDYLDMQDPQGWTPLHVACHKGHVDVTQELLNRGASVNIMTDSGDTAMHLACSRSSVECAELLLSHNPILDNANKEGFTPLHLSVKSSCLPIFKLLLENNCDPSKSGPEGSAEEMAKNTENSNDFLQVLRKHAESLEVRRAKFRTTAHRESVISIRNKKDNTDEPNRGIPTDDAVFIEQIVDPRVASIEEWNAGTPPATPPIKKKRSTPQGPLPPTPQGPLPPTPTTPLPPTPTIRVPPTPNSQETPETVEESKELQLPLRNIQHNLVKQKRRLLKTPEIRRRTDDEDLLTVTDSMRKGDKNSKPSRRQRSKSLTSVSSPTMLPSAKKTSPGKEENSKAASRLIHSNSVFEFIVQKRNTKTYQLKKRRLVIFQDKLTVYTRNKIHKELNTKNLVQCSRSIKYPKKIKLSWRYENKVEKYVFSSTEQRERFYEAIWVSRHGLNYHPFMSNTHQLKIFVGTWNMGNAPPPGGPDAWLQKKMDYDMYVIGLQECDYPDAKDNNTSVESHLLRWLSSYLGKQYVKLVGLSLWEIRMFILVKREHTQSITNVKTGSIACGVAGVMANKGAVGTSFRFHETSMAFICSHLAAHQNKTEDRNEHFRAIVRGLSPSLRQINNSHLDITYQVDHLFWIGDLNYRIEHSREDVLEYIGDKNWNALLKRDQLRREMELNKAFMEFQEGTIVFKPTYKYAIGSSDTYSEEKPVRVPAWCDRVLWKSLPVGELTYESYGCCDEITTSDHHPVFSTFLMKTRLANLPSERIDGFRIILTNLAIRELRFAYNDGSPSPYISFFGPFLESPQKTPARDKTRNPVWDDVIVELIPIITNRDYLISQSLRVIVGDKGKIVQEKHKAQRCAQTVISLCNLNKQPTFFEVPLTSCGYGECGILSGEVFIEFQHTEEMTEQET